MAIELLRRCVDPVPLNPPMHVNMNAPQRQAHRFLLLLVALLALPLTAAAQTSADCLGCHGEPSLSTTRKGKSVSLYVDGRKFTSSAHGSLDCVACHEGFNPAALPHARTIKPVQCQNCHADGEVERYNKSVHGKARDGKPAAACADCHSTHEIRKLSDAPPAERKAFAEEACARCHKDAEAMFRTSAHGAALAGGVAGAPSCIDCHDSHAVLSPSDSSAMTSRRNIAATCLKCHLDDPEVRAKVGPSAAFIASYENSVHARAVKSGSEEAAVCIDCHGSHDLKKGTDPASRVSRKNVAATCGGCHLDVFDQYKTSIHGTALAAGVEGAATCTDCHGEHNILSTKDENSPVAARNVSTQVCSPCHASVKLTQKYGLASDRFQTFSDSYHGLASKAGAVEVANCASCHGIHDIKPSSDSTSRINKANLARTCGKCHPGANENFTKGSVHVIATARSSDDILYLVSTSYIVLIAVIIGGMLFHNLLDFLKKSRNKLAQRRGLLYAHPPGHRLYLRMSFGERIQHGTLLVSFFMLVTTGFALKLPGCLVGGADPRLQPLCVRDPGYRPPRRRPWSWCWPACITSTTCSSSRAANSSCAICCRSPGISRDALGVLRYNLGMSAREAAARPLQLRREDASTGRWCGEPSSWRSPA